MRIFSQHFRRTTVKHPFTPRRSLLALILPLGFLASTASDAGGIPVADILNLNQDITNKIEYYDDTVRDIHGYLEKFQDVAYYEHSPCFTDDGCSDAERELVEINRRNASRDQKQANDAMFEMVQKQKEQLRLDSSNLEQERQRASTAKEQKAILAHANQFALEQTKQLMQIRALLVAQQEAVSAEMRKNADEEAKQKVAHKNATKSYIQKTNAPLNWLKLIEKQEKRP